MSEEKEVKPCHLHGKPNKACKFCKAFLSAQEQKKNQLEEQKKVEVDKEKDGLAPVNIYRSPGEKPPVPNVRFFPANMRKWIEMTSLYKDLVDMMGVKMTMGMIEGCTTCEVESEGRNKVKEPSQFITCVYFLLTQQLTQGELDSMLNSRCCYLRCAGCLYVRLGVAQEEYWELLSNLLMDNCDFLPFPEESIRSSTVGQYVEDLLTKDKYCDIVLPRFGLAVKNAIDMRLSLYEQFRRRYVAHLDALDAFNRSGLEVDVCSSDGNWSEAVTTGSPSGQSITVPVRLRSGEQQEVSIGMIIIPSKEATHDLTRSRGRSNQELLERYGEQAKGSALATGKNYCKPTPGSTRIAGQLCVPVREREKDKDVEPDEEEAERDAKRRREAREQERIENIRHDELMSKYCTRRGPAQPSRQGQDGIDAPERMRLG